MSSFGFAEAGMAADLVLVMGCLWSRSGRAPTLGTMGASILPFKPVLAALAISVAAVLPVQAQEADRVARLFEDLRTADPEQTSEIASGIREAWSRSGSATVDLLLERGREALGNGDGRAAIEHLTAVIDHAPDFAEAYALRANAYYLAGLTGPAIEDLRATLALEPRHFGALQGFAVLLEEMGRPEDAREIWDRVLALMPHDPQANETAQRLDIMLGGRTL